jgi:aminomethyltransferase
VRQTPLYTDHRARDAKIVDFNGWALPLQYRGILEEHQHTRQHTSLFDCSHMGEFTLRGREAIAHFDRVVCANVWDLAVGRCRYGAILTPEAGILDDTIMLRLGEEDYYVVTNAGPMEKISPLLCQGVAGAEDVTLATAKIDVQGPTARDVLLKAGLDMAGQLKYYQGARTTWFGEEIVITRAGYTGEIGFELFMPNAIAARVWDALLAMPGVQPAGLGARNTLRLEMGYPLSGEDFTESDTPLTASMDRFIDWSKEFAGKARLEAQRSQGGYPVLAGIRTFDRRKPQHGFELSRDDTAVGTVTSGTYGPSVGYGVGLASLAPEATASGTRLAMGPRGQEVEVTALPFYKEGTCRRG